MTFRYVEVRNSREDKGMEIDELFNQDLMEPTGGDIACPSCESLVEIYEHKYDPGISAIRCGSCTTDSWVNNSPADPNPRRCSFCDEYVTDADVDDGNSVECSSDDARGDGNCDQLAHKACVCDDCKWFCDAHPENYIECASCGRYHEDNDIVSFDPDFVEAWGHICHECFNEDDEQEALKKEPEAKKSIPSTVTTFYQSAIKPSLHTDEVEADTSRPRSDCSIYLSHFVGRKEEDAGKCFERLIGILTAGKLESRPTGYFSVYDRIPAKSLVSKAVCFTEGRREALVEHAKRFSTFGLSLSKQWLHKNHQAAPAIYVHGALMKGVRDTIPDALVPYINLIEQGKCDFHFEREWRCPADVAFSLSDVKVIYAPLAYHERLRDMTKYDGQIVCLEKLKVL